MHRAIAVAAVLLLWMAMGPWVLVPALASLATARVRAFIRPVRPWRTIGIGFAAVGMLAVLVTVIPDGWLPIPRGPGALVSPGYVGRPAITRPVTGMEIPQHPYLAPNGRSFLHNDAWSSGAHPGAGPVGEQPEVDTAWFGVEKCATLAFDAEDRIVALCSDLEGPHLRVLDPESMRPLSTKDLPVRVEGDDSVPADELCSNSSLYLDERNRAVVATTDGRILAFTTSDAEGDPDLTLDETLDVSSALADDDCLIALMPDWDGRIWFVTRKGVVGAVSPATQKVRSLDLGEDVTNPFSVDEAGGVYVVTTGAMYRLETAATGKPEAVWRKQYDRGSEQKPGQLSQGSGTTPTLLPGDLVAFADNADPRMNVVFLRRQTGEEVCRAPVFDDDASATESSLVAVGGGVIVENHHGYRSPFSTLLGFGASPGIARVDVADGGCKVAWTSDLSAPTSAAEVSLETGLLYTYTKRSTIWGVSAWYLTAVDVRTGRHVFSVRTGTGILMNNHHAAVTLGPDGSAYIATVAGMVRIRDRD